MAPRTFRTLLTGIAAAVAFHLPPAQFLFDTRADTRRLCTHVIGEGGACVVQRN